MSELEKANAAEKAAEAMYYKEPHRWPTGLQIEQVAAFMQGAKWLLSQLEEKATRDDGSQDCVDILKKLTGRE